MAGPEDKRPEEHAAAEPGATEPAPTTEDRLEVARRFLDDETVKNSPRDAQVAFLKSKDLSDAEIETLLGTSADSNSTAETSSNTHSEPSTPSPHAQQHQDEIALEEEAPRPPIITYPEFLTKPTGPEPLLNPSLVLNSAYALTGLTTLLYGTKKYLVEPMVAQLTAARLDLHASASAHVSALNARLQDVVSEIPEAAVVPASSHAHAHAHAHAAGAAGSDCSSECEDPSELFHRDIGTQTSDAAPSPFPGASSSSSARANGVAGGDAETEPAAESQTRKLAKLARSLADVKEGLDAQADDMHDYLAIIDNLRDDLRQSSVSRSYASLGWKQPEPDDEVKKAKDNIRRLKGVFLSARNFPVSAK